MRTIDNINGLNKSEFLSIFGNVFEKTESVALKVFELKPFKDSDDIVSKMLKIYEEYDRDKILQELNDEGINAGVVHVPNHYYTCFKDSFKELPETDYFNKHQISLPCGWWLDENDINHIANSLLEKCEKNSIIRK